MKNFITLLILIIISINLNGQFFVQPDGNDNNPGTLNEPWRTWNKAIRNAKPGDTVFLRGGVYYSTERIGMQGWTAPRWFTYYTPSGTADSGIVIMGYPPDVDQGNMPILDCSQHCENMHKTGYNYFKYKMNKSPYNVKYNSAIVLVGTEYITLKDFKVRNVYQCDGVLGAAITVIGNNVTYENISIENAGQIGFHHVSTSFSLNDLTHMLDNNLWSTNHEYHMLFNMIISRTLERPLVGDDTLLPAYWNDTVFNRHADSSSWKNCDVSYICDTLFFTRHDLYHYTIFEGDTLYAKRLYSQFNDFIIADTGKYGDAWKVQSFNGNYHLFEGCRAWNYSGDGFDIRGGKIVLDNCWAMGSNLFTHFNKPDGFVSSTSLNTNLLTYYPPEYQLQLLDDTLTTYKNCLALFCDGVGFNHYKVGNIPDRPLFVNNTSYENGIGFKSIILGLDTLNDVFRNNIAFNSDTNVYITAGYTESHNTWSTGINVSVDDFITTNETELINLFTAPRNSDHTLPDSLPLMLSMVSTLIDAGTYVDITYNGEAPDIGYSESNYQDVTQNIELIGGWNIASFYVEPSEWNILNIVNPLREDSTLVKVQDEQGNFVQDIYPYGWLNTIGDMSNEEGYYIYVNDNTNFNISGQAVTLPYNVDLYTGWNILGYPVNANQNALQILQPLIDDSTLIKVISEEGGFVQHIPPYGWLNTIGDFKPDKGYLIKLTSTDSLSYDHVLKSTLQETPKNKLTDCFTNYSGNPYMPMNILIKKIIPRWFKVEDGDELAVYDENILVGSIIIDKTQEFQIIVVTADDPTTPEKDGFTVGNEILFKYCDKNTNEIYENVISKYKWGDETFANLGTYLGRLRVYGNRLKDLNLIEMGKGITYLSQNYPNPFTNNTIIEYGLNGNGRVRLTISDMCGRVLNVLEDENKLEGDYSIYFINNLKPGMYFYNLEFKYKGTTFVQTKKMITY